MTTFPAFVICCRCCAAVAIEATEECWRWSQLTRHGHATLDICPDCARGVRAFLQTVPVDEALEADR